MEIESIEAKLPPLCYQLEEVNNKKEKQSEIEKEEQGCLLGLKQKYEEYSKEKSQLLRRKENLPIWGIKEKKEIEQKITQIHSDMQENVRSQTLLKKEFEEKYKLANEQILKEEKEIQKSISEIKATITNLKNEIQKKVNEKDNLTKLI